MTSNKRTIALILASVLALSLLLTACSNGGDTPSGDNTIPDVTDTETPSNTPDATDTTPDNAPAASDPPPGPSETDTLVKKDFAWLDPGTYDTEKKAGVDELIEYYGGAEVDIDKLIEEAFAEYSEYINENITLESVRTVIVAARVPMTYRSNANLTKMPEVTLQKVNDYLQSYGAGPLDSADYKQDIASLAIAASFFYVENWEDLNSVLYDLGNAFGCAYSGTDKFDGDIRGEFMFLYYIE